MTVLSHCRGHWALVTGASSGIGAEFCSQLAAAGVNLVMVARRQTVLESMAQSLGARHGVRTQVVAVDLARAGAAQAVKSATEAAGIRIRLLVNNAGFGPWGSFERSSAADLEQIVHLLAATPVALCRLFADDLRRAGDAGAGGAVINVSSPAALQPVSYMAGYAAAKACLHNFSLALYGEWQEHGIAVQTLVPAPTATEFDAKGGAYGSSLGVARRPPAEIVKASLAALSKENVPLVTNSPRMAVQRAFAGLAPVKLLVRQVKRMFVPPAGR